MTVPEYQIITQDPEMRRLIALSEKVAPGDATVLICGPTGSGKELFARHVHAHSGRAGPFVDVNCGFLSPSLLESTLFGHEAGAFTDARQARPGCFEMANRGSLFLDEISAMSPEMQTALLRVLEHKRVRRLGAAKSIPVDVKVVAATNRPLLEAVQVGDIRADLYYRLDRLSLHIPPLSHRRDDIPLLARHFVQRETRKRKLRQVQVTDAAMWLLRRYPWPGNVRELEYVMEKLVVSCHPHAIDAAAAWSMLGPRQEIDVVPHWQLRAQCFIRALILAHWRLDVAAQWFGVSPSTVRRALQNMDTDAYLQELLHETPESVVLLPRLNVHGAVEIAGGNLTQAAAILEVDRRTLSKWLNSPSKKSSVTRPRDLARGQGVRSQANPAIRRDLATPRSGQRSRRSRTALF